MLKPIETVYNGRRFRSRAEARIAVLLNALGVSYQYEREGYELGLLGGYLPDFDTVCGFIEVKGDEPTPLEKLKCATLAQLSGKCVYLISDASCYLFSPAVFCDVMEIEEVARHFAPSKDPSAVVAALEIARQARFEHGETPKPLEQGERVISLVEAETLRDANESPLTIQRRYNATKV